MFRKNLFESRQLTMQRVVVEFMERLRSASPKNKDLSTRISEVFVDDLVIYSQAETPPYLH